MAFFNHPDRSNGKRESYRVYFFTLLTSSYFLFIASSLTSLLPACVLSFCSKASRHFDSPMTRRCRQRWRERAIAATRVKPISGGTVFVVAAVAVKSVAKAKRKWVEKSPRIFSTLGNRYERAG